MKIKMAFRKTLTIAGVLSLVAQNSLGAARLSTPKEFLSTDAYNAENFHMRQWMDIPYYFNVPMNAFLDLPQVVKEGAASRSDVSSPVVVYDYMQMNNKRAESERIGLRILAVNGKETRKKSAAALADSGMIQTGDILLSFRKEWFGTLRYAHLQLGISHAGVAYVDDDGILRNLDMPMDSETVGKDNYLASPHYKDAPVLHVVRMSDMTAKEGGATKEEVDQRVSNISKWIKLFIEKDPYKKKLLRFNQDYARPNYGLGDPLQYVGLEAMSPLMTPPLKFVGDLGRLATGAKLPGDAPDAKLDMYCSEFAWALMSLRDCNPDDPEFSTEAQPSCIKKAFEPMSVLGNYLDQGAGELSDTSRTGLFDKRLGLFDGPLLILDALNIHGETRTRMVNKIFAAASGAGKHISSGHKAVENGILAIFPQFYDVLKSYYNWMDRDASTNSEAVKAIKADAEKSDEATSAAAISEAVTQINQALDAKQAETEVAPFQKLIDQHIEDNVSTAQKSPLGETEKTEEGEMVPAVEAEQTKVAKATELLSQWAKYMGQMIPKSLFTSPASRMIRGALNQLPASNYSPTAFMVHSLVQPNSDLKKVDYVGTIVYFKPVKGKKGSVDFYSKFSKLVDNKPTDAAAPAAEKASGKGKKHWSPEDAAPARTAEQVKADKAAVKKAGQKTYAPKKKKQQ